MPYLMPYGPGSHLPPHQALSHDDLLIGSQQHQPSQQQQQTQAPPTPTATVASVQPTPVSTYHQMGADHQPPPPTSFVTNTTAATALTDSSQYFASYCDTRGKCLSLSLNIPLVTLSPGCPCGAISVC